MFNRLNVYKPKTVNDMWKYAKDNDKKLLSAYPSTFWSNYVANSSRYDKLFRRTFKSFFYFMQERDSTIEEIVDDFIDEVYNHLLINDKKYSELYRLNVIDDEKYSIYDNYNTEENYTRQQDNYFLEVEGARTDTVALQVGSHTDTVTESIGQRSNSISESIGQRSDSTSETVGAKTDSVSETIGQRIDSETDVIGDRDDSSSKTIGQQSNSSENTVSPFDSESYFHDKKTDDVIGSRTDSESFSLGEQTNTKNTTQGSQSNSQSISKGAQTNSSSSTVGAQSNNKSETLGSQQNTTGTQFGSRSDNETNIKGEQSNNRTEDLNDSYTLTKKGNIGVKTVSQIFTEHRDFWTPFEFYSMIFRDICSELLIAQF